MFNYLVPQFMTSPNDPFLLSHANFPGLPPGSDRLPFANPLMNYPHGFPGPGLTSSNMFMFPPYMQYRLPPSTFPPSFLPPPTTGQMSSHSPHSQVSKSKSPITSQSSSHHSSSTHTSSKSHENKDFERRDYYQQDEDDFDPYLHRGPSPEPKIDDSECHRSQSAM